VRLYDSASLGDSSDMSLYTLRCTELRQPRSVGYSRFQSDASCEMAFLGKHATLTYLRLTRLITAFLSHLPIKDKSYITVAALSLCCFVFVSLCIHNPLSTSVSACLNHRSGHNNLRARSSRGAHCHYVRTTRLHGSRYLHIPTTFRLIPASSDVGREVLHARPHSCA